MLGVPSEPLALRAAETHKLQGWRGKDSKLQKGLSSHNNDISLFEHSTAHCHCIWYILKTLAHYFKNDSKLKLLKVRLMAAWDSLPPTIPRPAAYGTPQTVQMIATECPYTTHGLNVCAPSTCFKN